MHASMHAHWQWFAPSIFLLTGHTSACRHRRCHHEEASPTGHSAGHRCDAPVPRQQLGWEAFAIAYRAELDRWPRLAHMAVVQQIARWLQTFETVTILSFESSAPIAAGVELRERRKRTTQHHN